MGRGHENVSFPLNIIGSEMGLQWYAAEKIACPEGYEVVGYLLVPSTMIRSADDRNKLRHSANRLKEWLHDLTNYEAKRKLNPNALAPPYPFSKTLPDNPFRKEIVEIKDEVEEEVSVEYLMFSNLIMRLLTCA